MAVGKKKKWVAAVMVVAVLAGGGVLGYRTYAQSASPQYPVVETVPLEKMDLQNMVSVTGNVESTDKSKIFSRLAYAIDEVAVEVGDRVSEGDVLARLDTKALEDNIAQNQAVLSKSQVSDSVSLSRAQEDLANASALLESDLNSELLSAEQRLEDAEMAVRTAEALLAQEAVNLRDSRDELSNAREREYGEGEEYSDYLEEIDGTLEDLSTYRNAEKRAQIAYDEAKYGVADAKVKVKDAQTNLDAVRMSVEQQLSGYQSEISNSQRVMDYTSQNLEIEALRADLEDCVVTSPVNGVVTAVYAEEGAPPEGLMFVVEDTGSLKIAVNVGEYDIANVHIGDPVEIRADATGDAVYEGALAKIAPTSVKTAAGDSDTEADTEFECEISVTGDTELKIGMKARLNIIYEEKDAALAVPYEAVTQNENGESIVYVARDDGTGAMFARAVTVTLGMETDFDTEVASDGLAEGDAVIINPEGLTDGAQVSLLPEGEVLAGEPVSSGMFMRIGR